MKLWICEKPSVGRALAGVLSKGRSASNKKGYIEIDGGKEVVSWCIGHVLQQVNPEEYDEQWKSWRLENLPIIPNEWKLKPSPNTKEQFNVLRHLIGQATELVNVGDPDREGQLLVDEVIHYLKKNKLKTTRCFINNMNAGAIQKAVAASLKQDNNAYLGTYYSGLGRSRADWLVGMNYSRAVTLHAQKIGFSGVVSVGRVQTPTLALIVNRDKEIENFRPHDYFNINAVFEKGEKFKGSWTPKGLTQAELKKAETIGKLEEATEEEIDENETDLSLNARPEWLDESYRLIDENMAKEIIAKLKSAGKGVVTKSNKERKKENRPKLYSLSRLQSAMSSFGMSADDTLNACQKLYDAGYLTYPRTDSDFLPTSLKGEVSGVLAALSGRPEFSKYQTDPNTKNNIWNDTKADVHHAIIPTNRLPPSGMYSDKEMALYLTVAKAYLANFMPDCIADVASIEIECAGEIFNLNGKIIRELGWKELFGKGKADEEQELPKLEKGDEVVLDSVNYVKNQTTPKSLFIEGKMPEIMKNVYKLVSDPDIRKSLKKLDGIGTEATRARIIEDLKKRGFVKTTTKNKKVYLTSTELGRSIIEALPEKLTSFVLTSQWETFLNMIEKGEKTLEEFEKRQENAINKMLEIFETTDFSPLKQLSNSKKSPKKVETTGEKCPLCGGDLVVRTVKNGPKTGAKFLGCSKWAETRCNYADWDYEEKKATKKSTTAKTVASKKPSFSLKRKSQ